MTAQELESKYLGQAINVDFENGQPFPANQPFQCWDLVDKYSLDNGWGPITTGDGFAEGIFNLFLDPLPQNYDRIFNTVDNFPQVGDIVVWNHNVPGVTGEAGHVAIALDSDATTLNVLEQNNPLPRVTKGNHPYTGVLGWLRPKALNNQGDQPIMITEHELAMLTLAYYMRQPNDVEIKGFVGQPLDVVLEALKSSGERAAVEAFYYAGKNPPAPVIEQVPAADPIAPAQTTPTETPQIPDPVFTTQPIAEPLKPAEAASNGRWDWLKALLTNFQGGNVKPGYKTTEFWVAVYNALSPLVFQGFGIHLPGWGWIAQVVASALYIFGRAKVKVANANQ